MKSPTTLNGFLPAYRSYAIQHLKPKTRTEYKRLLEKLILPEFGERLLSSLTTAGIERWYLALAEATPVQANRALAVLSAVMQLATRWNYIEANPATRIPRLEEKPREAYLSPDEVRRLLDTIKHLTAEQGAFILCELYTGARPSELLSAKWEYWHDDTLQLPDSKTGRRTIYLPPAALTALSPLVPADWKVAGYIFPTVNPTVLWRKVKRKAGLSDVRMYDLRHTFASAALAAGLSLEVIGQLLGHRDPRSTKRYAHLMTETGTKTAAQTAAVIEGMGSV